MRCVALVGALALAMLGAWTIGSVQAKAAYQGPFCNNVFLWETEVCSSSTFSHSRRAVGHSYSSDTWVALYGNASGCEHNAPNRCAEALCTSAGCTADTGYYGSYGSGCGSLCSAEIQNWARTKGDWFFGYIYE